jgi:hypothetical protein
MEPRKHELKNGRVLLIREVAVEDARALLDYVERISGESDFLSFGPGEFELTESEEEEFICCHPEFFRGPPTTCPTQWRIWHVGA